jgi:hypothetical protein
MPTNPSINRTLPRWLTSLICLLLLAGVFTIPTYVAHAGQGNSPAPWQDSSPAPWQETPTPTLEPAATITPMSLQDASQPQQDASRPLQDASRPPPTSTITPFPQEWLDNHELTNGVTFGGIVIVVIVLLSTLLTLVRRKF